MFTQKVTVKIRKDKNYLRYIQIIRQYDNSLTMSQIKNAMENDEVIFSFDPRNNPVIQNGKDNSSGFLGDYFLKTLKLLKKTGADMIVLHGNMECVEFSKVSSAKENIDKLIAQMFAAKDSSQAFSVIDKLKKTATKRTSTRISIIDAMMKFTEQTSFSHMRSLVIPSINELVNENETQYADYYMAKIEHGDHSEAYYAIEGYAKVMQKAAYGFLVDVLLSRKLNMECEALIVCELSRISNQPFDSGSPYEKTQWTENDLNLTKIEEWKNEGYPDGDGYMEPKVHNCLQQPNTPEEKFYSALNKRLEKRREECNKAHPSYWLVPADSTDMERIKTALNPPANYMDFLMKASPLNVVMNLKDYGEVVLYGVHDLIEGQTGYSCVFEDSMAIDGLWPRNYIVIATCDANPFCIDASQVRSPIYYALHGMDEWDFEEAFPSLGSFLMALK